MDVYREMPQVSEVWTSEEAELHLFSLKLLSVTCGSSQSTRVTPNLHEALQALKLVVSVFKL